MACIVCYLMFYRQYAVAFTVHFMVAYLVFAIFEVISILKFVNNNTGQVPGYKNQIDFPNGTSEDNRQNTVNGFSAKPNDADKSPA